MIRGIENLLSKEDFLQHCEDWRGHTPSVPNGTYTDIYVGQVWKDFHYIGGSPFLARPGNLCLMLNIDWFNPYDETQYSVGAIYLVVQNLPRSLRFKLENIILIGLMPGPTEPSLTVNTYLEPLIDDFCKLYHGIEVCHPHTACGKVKIRVALSGVVCDLPATRKVCGFLGVNANKGCSKCLHKLATPSFGSKPDYSGYNCSTWEPRTCSHHYSKCIEAKNSKTATERSRIEKKNGAHYSELLRLLF